MLLVSVELVRRDACRKGWDRRHELALAVAVLPTYAWGSFVVTSLRPDNAPGDAAGNVLVALLVAVVVAFTARGARRAGTPAAGLGQGGRRPLPRRAQSGS